MHSISITITNQSLEQQPLNVVIFQRNKLVPDGLVVAWRVIRDLAPHVTVSFTYNDELEADVSDAFGNCTNRFPAAEGNLFSATASPIGIGLQLVNSSSGSAEIAIRNDQSHGSINANCYRGGKLLATKTGLVPGQKASFSFKRTLFIGLLSDAEEGTVIGNGTVSTNMNEIDLPAPGHRCAITITGGDQLPIVFQVENA